MAKKILIVDDETDVLTYLTELFSDNGYDCLTAANGKIAMYKTIAGKPDLITLDITMPEESGVRFFRDVQDNEFTKNIPIIIITGISTDFKKFIQSRKQVKPPAGYFEKPIDKELLLGKVKELIG